MYLPHISPLQVALLSAQLAQLRARLGVLGSDTAQLVQRRDALPPNPNHNPNPSPSLNLNP